MNFRYHNPVKISFGIGICAEELASIIGSNYASIDLFYDHNAMEKIGIISKLRQALSECEISEYGTIKPNPEINDLRDFLSNREKYGDLVIAIGGGSVMDFGKAVAFLARQKHGVNDFLENSFHDVVSGIPFIGIPTTSGTGSEVTPWATFWDKQKKKKYSISHELMFAKYAIVDPQLTLGLPPKVTASTGFDAISHSLEAFWSRFSNPVSDIFAVKSIYLAMANLTEAVENPMNIEARSAMSKASLYAGLAFSNTKTTAVHSVSYPMTLYYDIPHGVACALLLPEFLMFNENHIDKDKVKSLLDNLQCSDISKLKLRLLELAKRIGLPVTLKEAGIPRDGITVLLEEGFHPDRVFNNPRELTSSDLKGILERMYQ